MGANLDDMVKARRIVAEVQARIKGAIEDLYVEQQTIFEEVEGRGEDPATDSLYCGLVEIGLHLQARYRTARLLLYDLDRAIAAQHTAGAA